MNLKPGASLIQAEGWHNLRNDVTGEIGFEFTMTTKAKRITHLGLWDDHDRDQPIRPARAIPDQTQRDQPSLPDPKGKRRGLKTAHTVRLVAMNTTPPTEIARVTVPEGTKAELDGAFRYVALPKPIALHAKQRYALLTTTTAGDGDHFKSPDAFDGLPPLVHPHINIVRSLLIRDGHLAQPQPIPAFSDLSPDHSRHRLPVGPTLKFAQP